MIVFEPNLRAMMKNDSVTANGKCNCMAVGGRGRGRPPLRGALRAKRTDGRRFTRQIVGRTGLTSVAVEVILASATLQNRERLAATRQEGQEIRHFHQALIQTGAPAGPAPLPRWQWQKPSECQHASAIRHRGEQTGDHPPLIGRSSWLGSEHGAPFACLGR